MGEFQNKKGARRHQGFVQLTPFPRVPPVFFQPTFY
jgi:hypothetical protein